MALHILDVISKIWKKVASKKMVQKKKKNLPDGGKKSNTEGFYKAKPLYLINTFL